MNPLSGIFDEAWRMYKTHARHLLTIAFVIYLVAAVIDGLFRLLGGFFGYLLGALVVFIALYLVIAALVKAIQNIRDGRTDLSLGDSMSAAMPVLLPLIGASILASIAIDVGFVLLIIPGLFLITIWAVYVPAIVIERTGVFASFGRSFRLVWSNFWHVFATLVLAFLILFAVDIVLGLIFAFFPVLLGSLLATVIAGTLVAPFIALIVTLMYYRLSGTGPSAQGPVTDSGPSAA